MQELALTQRSSTAARSASNSHNRESDASVREAFETELATAGPLAFRVAYGVLRNSADAEDVAQEALLRAYRRFEHLREAARFRGWLVRIAFRLALDRKRSANRREIRETLWSHPATAPASPNAEQLAISSQFENHLAQAMEELQEKLRLVLLLSAMQGHTLEEIAAMLVVPIGTVKSRIFFARKQLAEKLRCHVNTIKAR